MSGDLPPELLEIFRQETLERLDRTVELLLALEAGTAADDVVDALFRDAHSIKGNAGMVGFAAAARVAGAMEDVLEEARDAGALSPPLVGPLLRASDVIRAAIDGDESGADAVVAELAAAVRGDAGSAAPEPTVVLAPPERAPDAPEGAPAPAARAPSVRTLRVPAERVDRLLDAVGETVLHRRRLEHVLGPAAVSADEHLREELDVGEALLTDLQDAVVRLRALPLASIVGAFPRAVRDIAATAGREVRLELEGVETQLDRVILDGISETIVHLLRNAISHGVEAPEDRAAAGKPREGRVVLRAEPRGDRVAVTVADDGRGVSAELLARAERTGSLVDVLADAGFSTAAEVSELSGRGVGLDAVKRHVESLGGDLDVASVPGQGTAVTLLLPLTLSLLHILLVLRGGQTYGLPLASVVEAVTPEGSTSLGGRASLELRGEAIALADLADVLGAAAPPLADRSPAVVVASSSGRLAVAVDAVVGEQETVVKPLGAMLAAVRGYLGGALLGDGTLALVLDPAFVTRGADRRTARTAPAVAATPTPPPSDAPPLVLVVDDQFTVRELQRSILEAAGYLVATARDGREALERARRGDVDLLLTDIEMPEMDGLALLAAVRADAELASLPVVVVTSRGGEDDRRRGAEAGADAYIVKSEFDQRGLLDTVGRLVALR